MMRVLQFTLILLASLLLCCCTEEETDLGLGLQDPSTLYNGLRDTAYCDAACMERDDSLLTSDYGSGLLGLYNDPLLGSTEAVVFSQITFPYANNMHIDSETTVDSAVLTLVVSTLHTTPTNSDDVQQLQLEVKQLSEGPITDTHYYDYSELPVSDVTFFDGTVRFDRNADTVIRMRLNDSFKALLEGHSYSQDEFRDAVKGIRIRMAGGAMATINFNAARTCITAFLRNDTVKTELTFNIGAKATHFNRFINDFQGPLAPFANGDDTIAATDRLYLLPMAGCNVRLSFNTFVRRFSQAHPNAVVHYAELLLPLANVADTASLPELIWAYKCSANGGVAPVSDMSDTKGFDGHYDAATGCYRLRITRHMQRLLLEGSDNGTLLLLDSRRSSPARVALRGPSQSAPLRIDMVYTE
ncbi:MAG: DUF4270 family protein [Bacteroidales bacterium]|nr:DUF4270 family protein [Bacteroidales bacterium]